MIKFVILTTQRSGSTWIVDMLNSHPEIVTYSELFLDADKDHPTWAGERDILLWNSYFGQGNTLRNFTRPYICFQYLNGIYSHTEAKQAIGFKLMYNQLRRYPEILAYMLLNKVVALHLIRENLLDIVISEESVAARGAAHSVGQTSRVQVHLDTSTLIDRLVWKEQKRKWVSAIIALLRLPCMEIVYEDLLAHNIGFDDILDFLEVNSSYKLISPLKKMNKRLHKDMILNYQEVFRTLEPTKYRNLLK